MASSLKLHDCFGSVLLAEGGAVKFLCDECGKEYARLDGDGLRIKSKHGSDKHENTVGLKTLKVAIGQVEKQG